MPRSPFVSLCLLLLACGETRASAPRPEPEVMAEPPETDPTVSDAPEPPEGDPIELLHPRRLARWSGAVCSLDNDGALDCFDLGDHCMQRPPAGRFASIAAQGDHLCTLRADGLLRCWAGAELEEAPVSHARAVSVGSHVCAITLEGTLRCWGSDYEGSVNDTPEGRFTHVAVGHLHSCALREDGTLACWGWGTSGQTEVPEGTFTDIDAASQRNCAIRAEGEMRCWGERTEAPEGAFRQVTVDMPRACGLRADGSAVCWGHALDGFTALPAGPYVELDGMCGRTAGGEVRCLWGDGSLRSDDGRTQIADANGACAPPPPAPAPTGPAPRRTFIDEGMRAVRAHDDDAVDRLRDRVEPGDLAAFVEEYQELTSWEEKVLLVHLVQDHRDPVQRPMMHDILRAPDAPGDAVWWARAVALAYFDGNAESFSRYFDSRDLTRRRVRERLAELDGAEE